MSRTDRLMPEFVANVPEAMEPGRLYVSLPFNMAMHLCCCGCGGEVATRISPAAWRLAYDGRDISLSPSIGPSTTRCRSHYWVRDGQIQWLPPMTEDQIVRVRAKDATIRRAQGVEVETAAATPRDPWYVRLARWLGRQ